MKEKLLAKQRAANAVHLKEKELTAAEELCSILKQEIQVCKAAARDYSEKTDEVRGRRAKQDTPGMQVGYVTCLVSRSSSSCAAT